MLARRPYSVAEMRRALEKKYPDSSQVPKAIARLRELHYLDDKKFAEHYASSLARNRAYGRYRIRRELKAKLVDYRQIEPALQQAFGETSEPELLEHTLEKKLRTLRLPLTRAKLASLCQSLLRRGFRSDDIIKAVRARPELRPVAEAVEPADLESGEKGNSE
jgi:regulatory protein